MNHDQLKNIKAIRAKWESDKSDCISYAKLMVDYFSYVNKAGNDEESKDEGLDYGKQETRM